MMKARKGIDITTQDKIKEAARKIFTSKGYAGSRTRDIADAAGINLALLNYYFKSKEKLFDLIMMETLGQFVSGLKEVLSMKGTSLKEKTEQIAVNYIDMLIKNPEVPVFILNELRSRPDQLASRLQVTDVFEKSSYLKQLKESSKGQGVNPIHYFMNTMAMVVFPFVGKPLIKSTTGITDQEFTKLMLQRKKFIAGWIESMLEMKY
jgi:AcrR family transcriptional regulator